MRPRSRWARTALATARTVVGVALVVVLLRSAEIRAGLAALFTTLWLLALLNLVPLAGAVLEARRLRTLFGACGLTVSAADGFRVVAVGALFSLWIPGGTGGDLMKLYGLAGLHPRRKPEVAALLLVDRVVALFSLLVVLLALLLAQPALRAVPLVGAATVAVAVGLALLVAGAAVVGSRRLAASALLGRLRARLPFGAELSRAAAAAHGLRRRGGALVAAVLLSLAGHSLLCVTLGAAGRVLQSDLPPLVTVTLALLGLIANVLPISPGGLGVGEAASETLFRAVGTAGGAALVAAWRVGTVLLCVVGALLYATRGRLAEAET
jgi:uncharacterized membrane protein YbhN (UPF0104 family)